MRFALMIWTVLYFSCSSATSNQQNDQSESDRITEESVIPGSVTDGKDPSDQLLPAYGGEKHHTDVEALEDPRKGGKQPRIVFDKHRFNFGEINHGEKVQHNFEFTNQGDSDLEIKNVRVSCGCTKPSYPFLAIPPGGEGKIGVTYNSVGKKGYQRATIRVFTNDPEQPEVVLRINGRVQVLPREEYEKRKREKEANEPE